MPEDAATALRPQTVGSPQFDLPRPILRRFETRGLMPATIIDRVGFVVKILSPLPELFFDSPVLRRLGEITALPGLMP